jgi:hypothetical protein
MIVRRISVRTFPFAEWVQVSRDLTALVRVLVALDLVPVGKDPAENCQARSLAPTIGFATTPIDRTRFFKPAGRQSSPQVNAHDSAYSAPQHEVDYVLPCVGASMPPRTPDALDESGPLSTATIDDRFGIERMKIGFAGVLLDDRGS